MQTEVTTTLVTPREDPNKSLQAQEQGEDCFTDPLENLGGDPSKYDRNFRFAGVGRLYANSILEEDQGERKEDQEAPHIKVVERLEKATVAVFGLGGVGSWTAEALCRSGIGNLVLIDLDDICISNTNRQVHTTTNTIGELKIDVMKNRLTSINPDVQITLIHDFVSPENVNEMLEGLLPDLDVVVDAIDGTEAKAALIATCAEKRIPIVTIAGAAGLMDPTRIVCTDLTRVQDDKLLRAVRKRLRQEPYHFPRGQSFQENKRTKKLVRTWHIPAVYSTELPQHLNKRAAQEMSSFRKCDGPLGSGCYVTGTFGFVAAGQVVEMIATNRLRAPRRG
jgi:tRNA threonylcarbamoyladenosine dehydratase